MGALVYFTSVVCIDYLLAHACLRLLGLPA